VSAFFHPLVTLTPTHRRRQILIKYYYSLPRRSYLARLTRRTKQPYQSLSPGSYPQTVPIFVKTMGFRENYYRPHNVMGLL